MKRESLVIKGIRAFITRLCWMVGAAGVTHSHSHSE